MKKFSLMVLIALLALFMFGCGGNTSLNDAIANVKYVDNEYVSMELIKHDGMCLIYRDKLTDVMYLVMVDILRL